MTHRLNLRRLVILGIVLVVAAFLAKRWPLWRAWTLPQANAACAGTVHYNGNFSGFPSCTTVAYGQLASGVAMLAGILILAAVGGVALVRAVYRWLTP